MAIKLDYADQFPEWQRPLREAKQQYETERKADWLAEAAQVAGLLVALGIPRAEISIKDLCAWVGVYEFDHDEGRLSVCRVDGLKDDEVACNSFAGIEEIGHDGHLTWAIDIIEAQRMLAIVIDKVDAEHAQLIEARKPINRIKALLKRVSRKRAWRW